MKSQLAYQMSILDTISNTPLVKLNKLSPNPLCNIFVKLEFFNPTASIKDRIVKYIIDQAEKDGRLKPSGTVIESTSGNTGASAAMIAAIKGYRCILTMPDKVSIEKQNTLKAFGAEIIICPTSAPPDSEKHYVNVAKKLTNEIQGSFRINQYDNQDNPKAHYLATGPEIWNQTNGEIDYFIASASTGGTVSGVARYLKEKKPSIKVIVPDPKGSCYGPYFKTGKIPEDTTCNYFVEGIGEDHLAKAMDFSLVDDVMTFTDDQAFAVTKKLAKEEGILAGGSSGANVWCALEIAKNLTRQTNIVTIIPDSGLKYLSKIFDDKWMSEHDLLQ